VLDIIFGELAQPLPEFSAHSDLCERPAGSMGVKTLGRG
jgi:hypothetical protein